MKCPSCHIGTVVETDGQFSCDKCQMYSQQFSQRLTTDWGDDDRDILVSRTGKTAKERKKDTAKRLRSEVEAAYGWPRGEALRFCAQLLMHSLQKLGVKSTSAECLPAVWHLFAKNANLDGCNKEKRFERYADGVWVQELEQRVINNHESEKLYTNSVQIVHLTKVVELIYICLVASGDQAMECYDLQRWLEEGHLPGKLMSRYFPPRLRLHQKDMFRFSAQGKPVSAGILYSTGAFMGLSAFPQRKLSVILRRLIIELQLPMAIFPFINALFKEYPVPKQPSFQHIPRTHREKMEFRSGRVDYGSSERIRFPEVRAGAFILVAMKMLFGLNDHAETKLSSLACQLRDLISLEEEDEDEDMEKHLRNIFVFTEWFHHINYRDLVVKKIHPPAAMRWKGKNVFKVTSLPTMLRRTHMIENQAFAGQLERMYRTTTSEMIDTRSKEHGRPIRSLIDNGLPDNAVVGEVVENELTFTFRPSLFPQRSIIDAYLAVLPAVEQLRRTPRNRNVPAEDFLEHLNVDLLKKRFTDRSIDYLTKPMFGFPLSPVVPEERLTGEFIQTFGDLQQLKSSMRKSYWVFAVKNRRERHQPEVLRERLPANFQKLLDLIAEAVCCDFVDLFDEFEVAEAFCVRDRHGYTMGRVSARKTRLDGVEIL